MIDRIAGNSSRLPFGLLLSIRSQIADRGVLSILSIVAIAASVALAASVEITSRSIRLEMQRTAAAIAGPAQLEVSAGDVGLPEGLVEKLRAVDGVSSASLMVYEPFRIRGGPLDGQPLHIVGVDLLYEMERRGLQMEQNGVTVLDPLRFIALPDSIAVGEKLADEAGVEEGGTLELTSRGKTLRAVVRAIAKGTFADAYAGQVAAMDVFALQEVLGRRGVVDRIQVELADGANLDRVTSSVREVVGAAPAIRRSGTAPERGDALLAAYELALWGVVAVAIATCGLLCFSIASMSLARRLEELSLLRAAGMDSRRSGRSVLIDAALQSGLGTIVGLLLSTAIVESVLAILSVAFKGLRGTSLEQASYSTSTLAFGVLVGVPTAVLAAMPAAWSAAQLAPLDLQSRQYFPYVRRSNTAVRVGIALCVAGLAGAALSGESVPRSLRAIGAIFAGGVLSILVVQHTLRSSRGLLERAAGSVPRIGLLVKPSLAHRRREASLATGIWALISASIFAAATTISSYTGAIDSYLYGLLGPDAVMFIASGPPGGSTFDLMDSDSLAAISSDPELEALAVFGGRETTFRGVQIDVSYVSWDVVARHGNVYHLSEDPTAAAEAMKRGRVLMNAAFAERFGAEEGEKITIATPAGDRTIEIGGRSSEIGRPSLILTPDAFRSSFGEQDVEFAAAWFRGPVDQAIRRVMRRAERQELFGLHGREARRVILRTAERNRELLWIPVVLVVGLGVLSLMALLYGSTRSRDLELMLLRSSGATRANIIALTTSSGVLVGVLGSAIGIGVGWIWAKTICGMLSAMVDWRVPVQPSWLTAAGILVASSLLATAAAVPPALLAARRARAVSAPPA